MNRAKIAVIIGIILLIMPGVARAEFTSLDFFSDAIPSVGIYHQEFQRTFVNIDPELTRGYNLTTDFKFTEARKVLENVATDTYKTKKVRSEAYMYLGYVFINMHDMNKAEKALNSALSLDPNNALAHFFLANIYFTDNDFEKTKKHLLKAVEIRPNFVAALRMLAETYKDEDNLDSSILYYKKIIDILPNSGYYRYQYYKATEMAKKYDQTVEALKFMKQLQPKFLLTNIRLGETYIKMKKFDDAKLEFEGVISIDPKFARAYEGMGKVYMEKGEYDKAFQFAKKAESLEPENFFVKSLLKEIERRHSEKRRKLAANIFAVLIATIITALLIYFYASHHRKQYIIQVIQNFNKSVDNIYDQNSLTNYLLNFFIDLSGASRGVFLLFNRQNSQLTARDSVEVDKDQLRNFNLYAGEEITNWLTSLKKYLLSLHDIDKDAQFEEVFPSLKDRMKELGLLYAFPLREKNSFVGFIVVDEIKSKDRILPHENDILLPLSTTSAQAISTLTLYESSITDELTGLYNKRHFWQNLTAEIKRSERYGQPVSLLTTDIDNFKRLNDTYGHPQGDRVLRELGQLVIATFRDGIDIGARIGGEEFAVILPATEASKAVLAAERLRKAIHAHDFPGFPEGAARNVTISMGLATYPTHCGTPKELVEKSDEALYIAKRTGKDKVCLIENTKIIQDNLDIEASSFKQAPVNASLLDETGLFSRAYFDERISGEVKRSERHSRAVSLLLMRADNKMTDQERLAIFREISNILQGNLRRGIDVPARIDKGTIAVLLPETDHNRAAQIARRLKQLVDMTGMESGENSITFSVGVSNYPNFGRTEESLLESARQALQMCQQMGGNKALIATQL